MERMVMECLGSVVTYATAETLATLYVPNQGPISKGDKALASILGQKFCATCIDKPCAQLFRVLSPGRSIREVFNVCTGT